MRKREAAMGGLRAGGRAGKAILGILALGAASVAASEKPRVGRGEEDLGIRKETLYDERGVTPSHGEYGKAEPGKSRRI